MIITEFAPAFPPVARVVGPTLAASPVSYLALATGLTVIVAAHEKALTAVPPQVTLTVAVVFIVAAQVRYMNPERDPTPKLTALP